MIAIQFLLRLWERRSMLALFASAILLAGLGFWSSAPREADHALRSTDTIAVSSNDLMLLGGGKLPTWKMLKDAYGLSDAQLVRSACLTWKREGRCTIEAADLTRSTVRLANGRLLLYLPNTAQ